MTRRRSEPRVLGTAVALALACGLTASRPAIAQDALPHLRKQGTATQLVVDGAPYLILGGELGNSSASSSAYMQPIWPKLQALHLNTVVAPVYWDLTEPREGAFDFALVDGLVRDARAHGMRLVLLWFGSWKNSMGCYAPAWVKTNQARFPRTETSDHKGQEILSPFSESNGRADARAFAALMRHLRQIDGRAHTVIMVQVENEIGMIPESRDHSPRADSLLAGPVPAELMAYLRQHRQDLVPELREIWARQGQRESGSWEEVFGRGPQTDELFMAWWFGRYVDRVAAAGKAEYPLLMYVNAALIRPGFEPGRYPSAGPLPHLLDVWRAAAPSIDFLAPDIYFPNFVEWTTKYVRSGNPLFIPEAGRAGAPEAPADAVYAIGEHDAIGFSPFSIENTPDPASSPLARTYAALSGLAPLILARQGRGTMVGVRTPVAFSGEVNDSTQHIPLGDYVLSVSFHNPFGPTPRPADNGALVIALAPDEFVVAGTGATITFAPRVGDGSAGILSVQEGRYEDGRWIGGRWLNGDEDHQGRHLRIPDGQFGVQRIRLYRYR